MPDQIQPTTTSTDSLNPSTITSNQDRFSKGQEFVEDKFHKFAGKADKVYTSKVYARLRPEQKQKIDDAIYSKYQNTLKFMGKSAPPKEWWHSQSPEDKLKFIKNSVSEPVDVMTWKDTGNYLMWRSAKTTIDAAQGILKSVANFGDTIGLPVAPEKGTKTSRAVNEFLNKQQQAIDKEYGDVWAGRINHHAAQQLTGGMIGFAPTALALMAGGSSKLLGTMEEITAAGGLAKYLAANPKMVPLVNTAIRAAKGAYDGYINDVLTGAKDPKGNIIGWAAGEAALGPLPGIGKKVFSGAFDFLKAATAKAYIKMAGVHGAEVVKESIMHEAPAVTNDPIMQPLVELNAKAKDYFAKSMFLKQYNFIPKEQKKQVDAAVLNAVQTGFRYPTAFDSHSVTKALSDEAEHTAKNDPEVGKIIQVVEENSKKLGGVDKKAVAERIQKETAETVKSARNKYDTNVIYPITSIAKKPIFQIGRGAKGNIGVQFPDQEHADLYALYGRQKKIMSGEFAKGPNIQTIADRFKMSRSEVLEASKSYREQINSAIKKFPEGDKFVAPTFKQNNVDPLVQNKRNIGPGAAVRYDPAFMDSVWSKWLSQRPIFEELEDNLLTDYWKAMNRPQQYSKAMRNKMIAGFMESIPDNVDAQEYIATRLEGMTEHLHMMHETEYLNRFSGLQAGQQAGHVFRSGNYISDDVRKKYKMPMSDWQRQLRDEYNELMRLRKKNPGATIHDVLEADE